MKLTMSDIGKAIQRRFNIASFRAGQFEIIQDVILGHDVCASIPTGAGKSLVYQSLAYLYKSVTVVVEPYISLIRDQIDEAEKLNIRAASIHSDMTEEEMLSLKKSISDNKLRLLFVTPERFDDSSFIELLLSINVCRFVIDEAHAVISMGEGFRPAYSQLGHTITSFNNTRFINNQRPVPILFLSATLTDDSIEKLKTRFELDDVKTHLIRTKRNNIRIGIEHISTDHKVIRAIDIAKRTSAYGATLIYVSCKQTAKTLYDRFMLRGLKVGLHHASLSSQERIDALEWYKHSSDGILITTSALSAGFNKADIRTVVHYHPSRTIEDYTQEIGRAGRDGEPAEAFCLYDPIVDNKLNASLHKSSSPEANIIAGFAFFIADKITEHHSLRINADKLRMEYGLRDITQGALRTLLAQAKNAGALDYMDDGKFFDVTLFSRLSQNKLIELINNNNSSQQRFDCMLTFLDFVGCKHSFIERYFTGELIQANSSMTCTCCYESTRSARYCLLSNNQIRSKLIALRQRKSKGFGLPAFALLPVSVIDALISLKPKNIEELSAIAGLDLNRIRFMGDDLLEVFNA